MRFNKRGQWEHVSDVVIGWVFVALGSILLSFHGSVYEGLDRQIVERVSHAHAERQLDELLRSRVSFEGRQEALWKVIVDGRDVLEKHAEVPWTAPFFLGDFAVIEDYPRSVFDALYAKGQWTLWSLQLSYEGMRDVSLGNPYYLDLNCDHAYRRHFLGAVTAEIPERDGRMITLQLRYCVEA